MHACTRKQDIVCVDNVTCTFQSAAFGTLTGCIVMTIIALGQNVLGPVWETPDPIDDTCDVTELTYNVSAMQLNMTQSSLETRLLGLTSFSINSVRNSIC